MYPGQKRFDWMTLSEEQSLWKMMMVVLMAANTIVTMRVLSLDSFPYWYAPLHPTTRKEIFEITLRAGYGPPYYTKKSGPELLYKSINLHNQIVQIEQYYK